MELILNQLQIAQEQPIQVGRSKALHELVESHKNDPDDLDHVPVRFKVQVSEILRYLISDSHTASF